MLNVNFKNILEAREYIRNTALILNPSHSIIKQIRLIIKVGNRSDYELLTNALVGMKNVKWIGIELGEFTENVNRSADSIHENLNNILEKNYVNCN